MAQPSTITVSVNEAPALVVGVRLISGSLKDRAPRNTAELNPPSLASAINNFIVYGYPQTTPALALNTSVKPLKFIAFSPAFELK